jgi:hypothetical protein
VKDLLTSSRRPLPSGGQYLVLSLVFLAGFFQASGQEKISVDGKEFTKYNRKYFSPQRGLFYSFYVSPVLTVDPLGISGKSTYALALGAQIRIWENKSADKSLTGLKLKGFYTAFGYEYYPRQIDKLYASLWIRIKTFMPLTGKIDAIYVYGNGRKGLASRVCVGFEVKKISVFLCGETTGFTSVFGPHPYSDSPYSNVGEILAIIPVFTRVEK